MAVIFIEGFDKYGPVATVSANVVAALTAGEWTTAPAGVFNIVAGLSSTGYAMQIAYAGTQAQLVKTFASTWTRWIGGIRFSSTLGTNAGIGFASNGTQASTITINTTGAISLRTGTSTGTALSTSSSTVSANSTHYLEWDITFGASSSYQVWLDGVSIFSGTGNTANGVSSVNQFNFFGSATCTIQWDDLYLFDSTTGTNNAVLNTNPRIETQSPTADSSVQFSVGAAILGSAYQATSSVTSIGAGSFILRGYTAAVGCVLNSVSMVPTTTSGSAKFKSCVYADSSGVPGSLLATGTEVVGCTSGTTLTSSFSSPPSLSASTKYWIGFINDTAINLQMSDTHNLGCSKTNTYASGPPNPAGTMTFSQGSYLIWGNVSSTGANYYEVDINPPPGDLSYVASSTVSNEDLYSFAALSTTPQNIYTMAVKGYIRKSDTGARTVSVVTSSSGSSSTGSNSGVTPATSYAWIDSFFDTDPHTSAAWTQTGLNAATSGVEVAS